MKRRTQKRGLVISSRFARENANVSTWLANLAPLSALKRLDRVMAQECCLSPAHLAPRIGQWAYAQWNIQPASNNDALAPKRCVLLSSFANHLKFRPPSCEALQRPNREPVLSNAHVDSEFYRRDDPPCITAAAQSRASTPWTTLTLLSDALTTPAAVHRDTPFPCWSWTDKVPGSARLSVGDVKTLRMPRASSSGKRQQGAVSTRDSRHENGLVGPTKRLSGKKSQGHLDGSARPAENAVAGSAGPSSMPAIPISFSNCTTNTPDVARNDARSANNAVRRSSLGNSSVASSDSGNCNMTSNGIVDAVHRQIDVNASKNVDVHRDSGPFDFATSVLKSLPVQDTLAILIFLMNVPSLSLSALYTIFTFLTFVPPVTTSSGMNINLAEIFDGNSTMPSLVTVLCMDFFFLLIWLFLWGPIQDAILDFAKPVIAITLGGGTSTRDGTSRGLTTCFVWVVGTHFFRGTRAHWGRVVRHIPEHWRIPAIFNNPLESSNSSYDKRSAYGWVRSVLAIHILTQGIVRYIREWYLRREKANALSGLSDPEAGKPPSVAGDTANEAGFATPDTDTSFQPVQNAATNKKRRKQSTQVRLQQPLWAALASTKIVMVKEYELSHATSETAGSNATDIHNLGNAPFDTQPDQIWISYIGSDEVCFSTSPFSDTDRETPQSSRPNGHASMPSGIDTSKPFYVRVNNAFWQPTRIFPLENSSDDSEDGIRWTGDIYGLRPASKYVCDFVDTQTNEVLFSTSIRTIQEPLREADGMTPAPTNGRSLRPDSPATTLKTSIAANELKSADEKNRLKTARKEWKTRINALRKDIEQTDNQLLSAGNHDEKYRKKILQHETQKGQAERDTEMLADQIKNFDSSPELMDRKKKLEKNYAVEKKHFDAGQKAFKEHKNKLEKEVKAKEVEKSNLNTRRNKIATRIAKVENELSNITDANTRGLDEAERRNQERASWQDHVAGIESNYNERLGEVRTSNAARSDFAMNQQMQLQRFHEHLNSANGMPYDLPGHESAHQLGPAFHPANAWINPGGPSHYSSSMWPNSTDVALPSVSAPTLPIMPPLAHPAMSAWHQAPSNSPFEQRPIRSRGRSSSMLSDVSGLTQSSGEDISSPMAAETVRSIWNRTANGRGGSSGSGSGSSGHAPSPR
ncbi:hypothetical protein G7046_g1304 [Stylonectria norvegica]|nr:hypothetical protein G7046_g1304 [Stylonectria norvegica]